jgi:hypothetical protein
MERMNKAEKNFGRRENVGFFNKPESASTGKQARDGERERARQEGRGEVRGEGAQGREEGLRYAWMDGGRSGRLRTVKRQRQGLTDKMDER